MKLILIGGVFLILLVTAFIILVLTSGGQEKPPGNPALPQGFQEAPLVEANINAYVYLRQDEPFTLDTGLFGQPEILPGLPQHAEVDGLSLFVGGHISTFGGIVEFSPGEGVENIASRSDGHTFVSSQPGSDTDLLLFQSDNTWADILEFSAVSDNAVSLDDRYPETWELMGWLPASPPSKPIAAGFLRPQSSILELSSTRAGINMRGLDQALGFFRLGDMAFGVYSDDPLDVPKRVNLGFLSGSGVSALLVARSGYPGWIVSLAMSVMGGRVDLDKVKVGDTTFRYRDIDGLHLFLHRKGSVLFAAVSTDRPAAEALIQSVAD